MLDNESLEFWILSLKNAWKKQDVMDSVCMLLKINENENAHDAEYEYSKVLLSKEILPILIDKKKSYRKKNEISDNDLQEIIDVFELEIENNKAEFLA